MAKRKEFTGRMAIWRTYTRRPFYILLLLIAYTLFTVRSRQLAKTHIVHLKQLDTLQNHLSHVLFWAHDSQEERAFHSAQISQTQVLQKNYDLLKRVKSKNKRPKWDSFLDWSTSSTAFTQLYYIEVFKQSSGPYTHPPRPRITEYENYFFPWLRSSVKELYDGFKGRGIVITTGNEHFQYAFLLIRTLREVLNCTLPIELAYGRDEDLSIEKRIMLKQFKDVACIDLSIRANVYILKGVWGWWWKAYAVLLSRFDEVIFIDADVILMVDPVTLFDHINYKTFGQLLYRDRRITFGNEMNFSKLKAHFRHPSDMINKSGVWNETTTHEAESGVLVYNKKNPMAFLALLNTCNLNAEPMLDHVNEFFYGDKETFWITYEMLSMPYAFVDGYGSTLGFKSQKDTICGPLAHYDGDGKLIWFNGGLAINKDKNRDEINDFHFYTTDNVIQHPGVWTWDSVDMAPCFKPALPSTQVKSLSVSEKTLISKFIDIYVMIRRDKSLTSS